MKYELPMFLFLSSSQPRLDPQGWYVRRGPPLWHCAFLCCAALLCYLVCRKRYCAFPTALLLHHNCCTFVGEKWEPRNLVHAFSAKVWKNMYILKNGKNWKVRFFERKKLCRDQTLVSTKFGNFVEGKFENCR